MSLLCLIRDPLVFWKLSLAPRELDEAVNAMLAVCGVPGKTVEVLLTNDEEMAGYNRRFMGCAGPTNILSLPVLPLPSRACQREDALETLILSPDAVWRESQLYGQDCAAYTLRLLAHGLVHLMGYEHGPLMERMCSLAEKAGAMSLHIKEGG
jgi:probable rRNA maturation factor